MSLRKFPEKYFFFLVTGIHLIPLLIHQVFFTIDGSAHLYNANIIFHLLFSENIFHLAFRINPELVPNWSGHIILFCLNFVFNPLISEKLLQILLVAGVPLSFRFAIEKLNSSSILWSYMIFPFAYSFVFINGFYNYCLSIIFFFVSIGLIASFFRQAFSLTKFISIWVLFMLTYLSHSFTFIFLIITAGFFCMLSFQVDSSSEGNSFSNSKKHFVINVILLFVLSAIPLFLLQSFLGNREQTEEVIRFSRTELLSWLWHYRPLVLYAWDEAKYTQPLLISLLLGFVWICYEQLSIKGRFTLNCFRQWKLADWLKPSTVFFLLMMFSLLLYFILPDTDRNASFISVRTSMMFFFFWLLWLAQLPVKRWLLICLIFITVSISFWRLKHISRVAGSLNDDVVDLIYLDQFIQPEKVIIPIDVTDNWLYGHLLNYIAVFKPVLLLENYEASKKYFPVLWREESFPNYSLGRITQNKVPCLYRKTMPDGLKIPSDYVIVNGHIAISTDTCLAEAYKEILYSYEWVTNSGSFTLYGLRK